MVKYKCPCPGCFADSGQSIVMEENRGTWQCPKNSAHRFVRDSEGFWVKAK